MKNAIISGIIIGVASGLWIAVMHFAGLNPQNIEGSDLRWMEYTSVLIPFIGLYFGIKGFRRDNNGNLSFFQGVAEGFKIIIVGGLISAAFTAVYMSYFVKELEADYMNRVAGAVLVGILFTLVNSLLLMNNPKML